MNDKELAEKVAGYLGWQRIDPEENGGFTWEKNGGKGNDVYIWKMLGDWKITGLMIEEMDEKGWFPTIWQNWLAFEKNDTEKEINLETKTYSTKEHGYHKAIALAFVEAQSIILQKEEYLHQKEEKS